MRSFRILATLVLVAVVAPGVVAGQGRPDPAALQAAQREAMVRLAPLDGVWRGAAWTLLPSGERHELTQTDRVGPFLDGAVRVIEGLGYEADGSVGFNALGVISYDPATQSYSLRSYAMGRTGDFELAPTDDGYIWSVPAGPMTIRYTATIADDTWTEVGDRIVEGRDSIRFFEMKLTRVGDSDWPVAGTIPIR
jgi:hypothetical protein